MTIRTLAILALLAALPACQSPAPKPQKGPSLAVPLPPPPPPPKAAPQVQQGKDLVATKIVLSWTNTAPVQILSSSDLISWSVLTNSAANTLDVTGPGTQFFRAQVAPKVLLAWNASPFPGVVGYKLFYGSASRTYTNRIDVGNALSCSVTNLVPGIPYFFAVVDYTASGIESDYSDEVVFTPSWRPVFLTISLQ